MYKPGHLLCPRSDNILVYQLCRLSWVLSSHSWLLWQSSLPISGSTCTCITPHERSFKTGHLCIAWTNSLYLEFFQALFLQVLNSFCVCNCNEVLCFSSVDTRWYMTITTSRLLGHNPGMYPWWTRLQSCEEQVVSKTRFSHDCRLVCLKVLTCNHMGTSLVHTPYPFVFPLGWNVTWLWLRSIA